MNDVIKIHQRGINICIYYLMIFLCKSINHDGSHDKNIHNKKCCKFKFITLYFANTFYETLI